MLSERDFANDVPSELQYLVLILLIYLFAHQESTDLFLNSRALHKSRNGAPKAWNMKARGKCRASEARRPWCDMHD
jgi:hypothetical protein